MERLECIEEILRIAAENRDASAFLFPLYMRSDEVEWGETGYTHAASWCAEYPAWPCFTLLSTRCIEAKYNLRARTVPRVLFF